MAIERVGIHALIVTLSVAAACGAADGDERPDPTEIACEEVGESGTTVTAAGAPDESAPEIELGADPYTVALSATEAMYVRVEIAEHTRAVLLVNAEDAVTGLFHGEDPEGLVSAGPVEHCAEDIPEHYDVDFHESGTYYLEFAPSAVETLWLVLVDAAGHAHDDHEH